MINIRLETLIRSADTLKKIGDQPLQGRLAYKIGKIIQEISNELELYDDARHKLLEKYCIKDEAGNIKIFENNNVQVPKESIDNYNNEIKKLNETEVELNILLLELNDFETIKITPKEIMDINWLIKKEDAE